MPIVYYTATSLNGFLADEEASLDWLFALPGPEPDFAGFLADITVMVCGATTYEWVLGAENLLAEPEKWAGFYGARPLFVFTHRRLPVPEGADVRLVAGPVSANLPEIRAAAGPGSVWLQGGGDLAGQFLDAGALDRIEVSVAPVVLAGGAPLLPRTLLWDRLRLRDVTRVGQFAQLSYDVAGPAGDVGRAGVPGRGRSGSGS